MLINIEYHIRYWVLLTFFFSFLLCKPIAAQDIAINEIMASNANTISDEDGDFPDWIELYNYGTETIDLSGWGLSDDYDNPFRWEFPQKKIQPGEFLLVWASGKNRRPDNNTLTRGLMREVYENIPGNQISHLINHPSFPYHPTSTEIVSHLFEAPTNVGDNYGQRMHGWIKAPVTGLYSFWIAGDDECHLYLSTNENPDNTELIARVPEWSQPREWNKYPEQKSQEILLQQGQYYYIKALMKEAYGGDCLAVGWQLPNGSTNRPISGEHLYWNATELHTNFSISSTGEEILLTHPSGERIDEIPPLNIPTDISYGRSPDGTGELMFFSAPTPGESNTTQGYSEILLPPEFSHNSGFYTQEFDLTLHNPNPDAQIVYTIDGSEALVQNLEGTTFNYKNSFPQNPHSSPGPMLTGTITSALYTQPISITNQSSQMEILAQTSSTFDAHPNYFPSNRIFKGNVVRARAVKEGAIPSPEVSGSYYITPSGRERYSLPVLSLSIQADYFFDYETGIYTAGKIFDDWRLSNPGSGSNGGSPANYWQRGKQWEHPAHLDFFEEDAWNPSFSQGIGVRIHGAWSRAFPMKSLRLYARNEYGESRFNHTIFPDQPYQSYNRLILRNSGNDYGITMFRDAAIQAVVADLDIDVQAYRPVILFVNGEYWGLHNIRERYDKHYLNRVYGVDPDNIDVLTFGNRVKEGDNIHYNAMIDYIGANGLQEDTHYQHLKTLLDVDNFIDYQISHIYAANYDWPGNNNDSWRYKTSTYQPEAPYGHDGRWRWLVYDTDFGFSLMGNATHNTLAWATQTGSNNWANPDWSTFLLRKLLENMDFKHQFINRFADLLNTTFHPVRTTTLLNQMKNALEPEMEEHINRWSSPGSMNAWNTETQKMTDFVEQRPTYQRQHIQNKFGLSNTLLSLTVDVSNPLHGHVKVNTIHIKPETTGIEDNPYPWTGTYFHDIPIELKALPAPGHVFSHWQGLNDTISATSQKLVINNTASVKAHFTPASSLHYWHFNDLPSGTIQEIIPDHSLVEGAFISYPGSGDGYMDRVSDGTTINGKNDVADGYGLRVRNPSDSRELQLAVPTTGYHNITLSYATKRTNNGSRIQEIQYRSTGESSWNKIPFQAEITEEWNLVNVALPPEAADNNPDLSLRILFLGDYASGSSGNNRFDNIRIDGLDKNTSTNVAINNRTKKNESFKIWHHHGLLSFESPFSESFTLSIYNTNGSSIGNFLLHGEGQHSIMLSPTHGIYVARLVSERGLRSAMFVVN